MLKIKRVYDPVETSDGWRVLIDRLWARGLKKEGSHVDAWYKELGPSNELRKWFNHEPEKWDEFRCRYLEELSSIEKRILLKQIAEMARRTDVTLLYSSKETRYNNAVALEEVIRDLQPRRTRETATAKSRQSPEHALM
jgi:uncharacterized protein YeaO (DUF488 family)